MNTKQAKDFLVQQTAEQAVLENVPLSDLEKRMMYFTESDPASCDNPIDLNGAFEERYDTEEYEPKISRLLHHAYKRLKHEGSEKLSSWNEGVRVLRKGDHYILVLLDLDSELVQRRLRLWWAIAWGLGLGIGLVILMMMGIILDHYGLFPRKLFAWVAAVVGWISGDPTDDLVTRKLHFYLITIVLVGVWFLLKLTKRGVLREFLKDVWNGATSSVRPKSRPANKS